jgi:hypothetical protein
VQAIEHVTEAIQECSDKEEFASVRFLFTTAEGNIDKLFPMMIKNLEESLLKEILSLQHKKISFGLQPMDTATFVKNICLKRQVGTSSMYLHFLEIK